MSLWRFSIDIHGVVNWKNGRVVVKAAVLKTRETNYLWKVKQFLFGDYFVLVTDPAPNLKFGHILERRKLKNIMRIVE